jgi:hypothetical protein
VQRSTATPLRSTTTESGVAPVEPSTRKEIVMRSGSWTTGAEMSSVSPAST